ACRPTPYARSRPRSGCEPTVLDLLAANPLLTIMLFVSLGTLLGAVSFGPVRFGPAGALFVGLGVGALDPRLGRGLGLVQTLGLALFVYMVGIAVGARFFRGLRRQLPLMASATVVLGLAGLAVMVLGSLLGISPAGRGGVYAGALTQYARPGRGDLQGWQPRAGDRVCPVVSGRCHSGDSGPGHCADPPLAYQAGPAPAGRTQPDRPERGDLASLPAPGRARHR